MRVEIVRDHGVCPGGESWLVLLDEMVFVASAAGVSPEGAECLQQCWGYFIERGIWRWRAGGKPIRTEYHRVDRLISGAACSVRTTPGLATCLLSAEHFSMGSTNGLQSAARDSIRNGWTYFAPVRRPVQAAG